MKQVQIVSASVLSASKMYAPMKETQLFINLISYTSEMSNAPIYQDW